MSIEKKYLGALFCMLMIISTVVPVTGRLDLGTTELENNRNWITLPNPLSVNMLLERSICRRMSFHNGYPATPVTDQELSTVLWAAYGVTTTGGRTIYSPNGTYSTTLYVIRSDATYVYVAANHSLRLWITGNHLNLGQATGAPIKFGMVWNMSITPDEKAGMAEIGMIAQNVYFDANALNLATITTGMSVSDLYQLGLPSNEKPEIIMHLGHPPTPYDFTYSPLPVQNLPRVVNSTKTLVDAVTNRSIVNKWGNLSLSLLEESQTLWASYGTSYYNDNINHNHHRTLPSAINIYPFKVFAANKTGVYQYAPSTHSVTLIVSGDKREQIQDALAYENISVASAPWIIIPFWDKNVGSQSYLTWWWYENGAIIHDILLEGAVLNLSCNVVTVILDQAGLRTALGISGQTNLQAMSAVMVGHKGSSGPDTTAPVTTCTLEGTMQGGVYISPVTVTLNATDDNSGVKYTKYRVDTAGWDTYTAPFTVTNDGAHTVYFYSEDNAGNLEIEKNRSFTIQYYDITVINGGVGVSVTVKNIGVLNQTQVPWSIALTGGLVLLKGKSGIIDLKSGAEMTVKATVFGIGKPVITVTVGKQTKTATGVLFFFFVFGVK